jgi:hypothetical protein
VILVVSHPADDHATSVLAELERMRHSALLIDTALFPTSASITQRFEGDRQHFEFSTNGHTIDLGTAGAGWWRRPQPFLLDPALAPDAATFTYTECHEALAGLWAALDLVWVNAPERDEKAHHKPYQLAVAAEVGLRTPRTVITNDPEAARRLIGELGPEQTVYKTFLASERCWRETRVLQPPELGLLDRVRLAPVIFQEYVPAVADIRATIIGPRIFATAITAAPGSYSLDYRMDLAGARFKSTTMPAMTDQKIHLLM